MEREEDLQEAEKKLTKIQNEHEDALKFEEYNQDMLDFLVGQFSDVIKEEEEYENEEKQFENAINLLENELQVDNMEEEEQKQNSNLINQQVEQDMKDETSENSIAEENNRSKENAAKEKDKALQQMEDARSNISEISENQKKIEEAKRQKDEQEKKMKGIFGFLSVLISIFCPISGAITALIGALVTNGDYESALTKLCNEKYNRQKQKEKQEGLFKRYSDIQDISEEKFQKAIKSAQSKSSSILKGLNTKKEVEQKLTTIKNTMSNKLNSIQDKVEKKFYCAKTIEKFRELHQEILPKIGELKTAKTNHDLATLTKQLMAQQQVVKTLRTNKQKNSQSNQMKQVHA